MAIEQPVVYEPHVGPSRQYWRDIVLALNDGLVSMLLLVAGVVGGGLDNQQVLLTGVAGALAGAVSMAAGEYLATKSQQEVLDSELGLERTHIRYFRDQEVDQLYPMLRDMGIVEEDIETVVAAFSRNDEVLFNSMKVLEFGMVDTEQRSPIRAMFMSGGLFLLGSMPSVAPFLIAPSSHTGLLWAAIVSAAALVAVGVVKTLVTRTNPITSGLENLIIAGVGGAVAYGVGRLVGVAL